MEKLGQKLQQALAAGIPAELTALVVATSHPKRQQELQKAVSRLLLDAHQAVLVRPSSVLANTDRECSKALLDLVRARIGANGYRKPSIEKMLAMTKVRPAVNLVPVRRAA